MEAMGVRTTDWLLFDQNNPQIAFHLHRDRELADRLEKAEGFGRPHEIIHWGRERDENQVTVSVRIGDGEPDVWLGFHPEASLSVMRLVKFVLADG